MRAVAVPGRWVWRLSGLVAAAALAIPGTALITMDWNTGQPSPLTAVPSSVTVAQPVTSLTVQSYGGQVVVMAGQVSRVQVREQIIYGKPLDRPPAVVHSVSGGRLTVADPACNSANCTVNFDVTVPPGLTVTVESAGGEVSVSGTAGADLDSGGGPVHATDIGGPLTATTGGGDLTLYGLHGPLRADTYGGALIAGGVNAATATVTTGGGPAVIAFAAAPDTVTVSTDGGSAALAVPGGPYALTAESDGGPQSVGIATDPAARASITVTSGGGPLRIEPAAAPRPSQPASPPSAPAS